MHSVQFTHSSENQASFLRQRCSKIRQDKLFGDAKVNSSLMKESANWVLNLGTEGAENLFLCTVFGSRKSFVLEM